MDIPDELAPGPLLVRTSSVEEAEARAAELLSPHRPRIGAGTLDAKIHGISLGSVALYRMNYGAAVTVSGPPLDGYLGALLPWSGAMRVTHGSARFEIAARRSVAVITPRSPMVLDWTRDLDMFVLRLEAAMLERFAENLTGRVNVGKYVNPHLVGSEVFSGFLGSARMIQFAVQQLSKEGTWSAGVAARLREQVMLTTLIAQPAFRELLMEDDRRPTAHRAVKAAVEMVNAEPTRHLTTVSLAAAVGVSARTLQLGFREILDVTPHAYMLSMRLRRAREDLLAAQDEDRTSASVSSIARRWGFVNIGRFAAYYEQAYGEKPLETLRPR